ncbi:MAG TPA: hypothetical protein GX505_10625 [Clostridiales bacterium]|nr:hypothetical protein [Clostridiales bacterium]
MVGMKVKELLESRHLPQLLIFQDGTPVASAEDWSKRRLEILGILCREEYGHRLPEPLSVSAVVNKTDDDSFAGKVLEQHISLTAHMENGTFSFPVYLFIPKSIPNPMTIVYIAFRPDIPDRYFPVEEITDEGFAVAMFCYNDIVPDLQDDFTKGLAALVINEGKRDAASPGKIMMWSWAASRVMDYLETRDDIDLKNTAVMGHSRLGKTSLVTAAYDERFAFCFPNNAGCSGDAITRQKKGERVEQITKVFPYWFCLNYAKFAGREEEMPFDQHFLIAAIAPRFVCSGAAAEDIWADPDSQYLSLAAADEVYRLLGREGFVHPDRLPEPGDILHEGSLGYHMRSGTHFHSRYDWLRYLEFMKKHKL